MGVELGPLGWLCRVGYIIACALGSQQWAFKIKELTYGHFSSLSYGFLFFLKMVVLYVWKLEAPIL